MIDLDALDASIAEGEKKNFFVAPIVKELIAELRHAREENKVLMQTSADPCLACGWRFFVPGEGCQGCLVEQLRTDTKRYVADERAAVVAFLRETLATSETAHASDDLDYAIDIIERGEHRREENKT